MASTRRRAAPKGTAVLRGGKGVYSAALLGNWAEDRVGERHQRIEPPGFETTKATAELEAARVRKTYFGRGIKDVAPQGSIIGYQSPRLTGQPRSVAQTAFSAQNRAEFTSQFGSKFPLKPARALSRRELDDYRAKYTADSKAHERFVSEKNAMQAKAVTAGFRVCQDRRLRHAPVAVQDLQQALLSCHGPHALHLLDRVFRSYDLDGNGVVSSQELAVLIADMDIPLAPHEFEAVFKYFDRDGSGSIDYEEFVSGLCGELSVERRAAVQETWAALCAAVGAEEVVLGQLLELYADLPEDEVPAPVLMLAAEFPRQWGCGADEPVPQAAFERYFERLSPAVSDDRLFERFVRIGAPRRAE